MCVCVCVRVHMHMCMWMHIMDMIWMPEVNLRLVLRSRPSWFLDIESFTGPWGSPRVGWH